MLTHTHRFKRVNTQTERFVLTHAVGSSRVAWGHHGRHAARRGAGRGRAGHHAARHRLAWSHRSWREENRAFNTFLSYILRIHHHFEF